MSATHIEGVSIEAQNLGLHYIELMVLLLSDYTGSYVNRLKSRARYHSQVEIVPWGPSPSPCAFANTAGGMIDVREGAA